MTALLSPSTCAGSTALRNGTRSSLRMVTTRQARAQKDVVHEQAAHPPVSVR